MIKATSKDLCEMFDIVKSTLHEWTKRGLPKISVNSYDVIPCFRWWCENINSEGTEEEKSVRDRYWLAKAENEELKLAKTKEKLVVVDKVKEAFVARATNLRTSLHGLAYRLGAVLEGKNQDEIILAIMNEVNEMLRNFCRKGQYVDGGSDCGQFKDKELQKPEKKVKVGKKIQSISDKTKKKEVKKAVPIVTKKRAPRKISEIKLKRKLAKLYGKTNG